MVRFTGNIDSLKRTGDADIIAILYRDVYYTKDSQQKDRIEVILAKHRNVPTGTVELGYSKRYGEFYNL